MNLDRKISLILIAILIVSIIATIFIIFTPYPSEKFTEFYILGSDGKAGNYPTNLNPGQTGNLKIGIVNHEQTKTIYNLIVKLNNNTLKNEKIDLLNNEKIEIPFSFTVSNENSQILEFLLYKLPDNVTAYRYLYLNINGT